MTRSGWRNMQDGFEDLAAAVAITDEERRALLLAAEVMHRGQAADGELFACDQNYQEADDIAALLRFVATNAKPSASTPPWTVVTG